MPARALLIDLDGVLRHWPRAVDDAIESRYGLPAGSIRASALAPDVLDPAITGRCSDEAWRKRIVDRLAAGFGGETAAQAVAAWSASAGQVDGDVLAVLRACRERASVVLVSNATSRLARDLGGLGSH